MKNNHLEEKFLKILEEKILLMSSMFRSDDNNIDINDKINELINGLHASEIAYIIQYLNQENREKFVNIIKDSFNPEIFFFVDKQIKSEIMNILSCKEIANILDIMDSNDSLELLSEVSKKKQLEILSLVSEDTKKNLENGLLYPEESAARLMQQDVLVLKQSWSVRQSIGYIASEENLPENFYDLFIIDNEKKPIGMVSLTKLIKSNKSSIVSAIMNTKINVIPWNTNSDEVAFLFRSYDLMSAPVVDKNGVLIGVITIDDVVSVIEEKAEEDIMHMGGITNSDFYTPIIKTSFIRVKWLIIAFIDAILSAIVIDQFQSTFQSHVALTVLLPIAAAMAGNAGMQSLTMTIRALIMREINSINALRSVKKEVMVSLINSAIFALILALIGFLWFGNLTISMVLGGSVIFSMVWAGFAGTFLPIFIEKMGFDPALSAAPLLSVTTDIFGFTFFLGLAKLLM